MADPLASLVISNDEGEEIDRRHQKRTAEIREFNAALWDIVNNKDNANPRSFQVLGMTSKPTSYPTEADVEEWFSNH